MNEPYDIQDVMDMAYVTALRRKCKRAQEKTCVHEGDEKAHLLHVRKCVPHAVDKDNVHMFEELCSSWWGASKNL